MSEHACKDCGRDWAFQEAPEGTVTRCVFCRRESKKINGEWVVGYWTQMTLQEWEIHVSCNGAIGPKGQ